MEIVDIIWRVANFSGIAGSGPFFVSDVNSITKQELRFQLVVIVIFHTLAR